MVWSSFFNSLFLLYFSPCSLSLIVFLPFWPPLGPSNIPEFSLPQDLVPMLPTTHAVPIILLLLPGYFLQASAQLSFNQRRLFWLLKPGQISLLFSCSILCFSFRTPNAICNHTFICVNISWMLISPPRPQLYEDRNPCLFCLSLYSSESSTVPGIF